MKASYRTATLNTKFQFSSAKKVWHGNINSRNKLLLCHTVTDLPFILPVMVNISIKKLVYQGFITGVIKQLCLKPTWQTTIRANSKSYSTTLKTQTASAVSLHKHKMAFKSIFSTLDCCGSIFPAGKLSWCAVHFPFHVFQPTRHRFTFGCLKKASQKYKEAQFLCPTFIYKNLLRNLSWQKKPSPQQFEMTVSVALISYWLQKGKILYFLRPCGKHKWINTRMA